MATRANILLKDSYDTKLWFYKHSDGYPQATMPLLNKFMDWLKAGKIRREVGQSAGWLIILGAIEDNTMPHHELIPSPFGGKGDLSTVADPKGWKVGSIEPTTEQHGDIDWIYVVDVDAMTIEAKVPTPEELF